MIKLKLSKKFSKEPRTKINNKKPKDVNQETNRKEDWPVQREKSIKKNKETITDNKLSIKNHHVWHHEEEGWNNIFDDGNTPYTLPK